MEQRARAAHLPAPVLQSSATARVQDVAEVGGGGATAAGKMVMAAPEPCVMKPREMSVEERGMNRAPQGNIFDVVVLETSEVPKSLETSQQVEIVRTAAGKSGDWGALYLAVSSVRTLLVHHDEVFSVEQGGEADGIRGLVGLAVPIVTDAVSHNRSAIQSVGLRCLEELFSGEVGAMLLGNELEQLVRAAGVCYRASKTFILTAGKKAMDAAAEKADPILLLSAVLPQGLDKHQNISAEALVLADKCLSRLNVGDVPGGGMPDGLDKKLLVEALAKGAQCRVSSAKEAASKSLERRVLCVVYVWFFCGERAV